MTDGVGQDADEREAHARVAAVRPEGDEQEREGAAEERERAALRRAGTPALSSDLGAEPDEDRDEEQADPVEPDRRRGW